MYYPHKEFFLAHAHTGHCVPVYKEMLADCETPVSAFLKLHAQHPYAYLLESVEGNTQIGRYSFLGLGAEMVFQSKGNDVHITRNNATTHMQTDHPLSVLEDLVKNTTLVLHEALPPFYGGAVGYCGYDTVRFFEKLPRVEKRDDLAVPDMLFVFAQHILVFDRLKNTIAIVENVTVGDDPQRDYADAIARIDAIAAQLQEPVDSSLGVPEKNVPERLMFTSNTQKQQFLDMVSQGKEYIRAGDILQVVLSQRWKLEQKLDLFSVYRHLRTINPSPYMFYLKFGDITLVGSSPEVMVKGDAHEVMVRPIAGTRPRGKTMDEDIALEKALLADEKERAEHVMLVDLGRNDVGRVAAPGTVVVDELMAVERYSHVMHIVSHVHGVRKEGTTFGDILTATFPAGTVSGAPKIRAMEIIEELEPSHRGPYAGAVAYLSFSGHFDSCIIIRTLVAVGDTLYVQAGAGIVADSDPETEYRETVNKATAVFRAIAGAVGMNDWSIYDSCHR